MDWLTGLFTNQTFIQAILVLSLICAIGLICSRITIKGVSLGITFIFFAGIIAGHFGLTIDPQMLALAQNFGLILFVYALGLQVGPSFFPSLKKGGIKLNLLGLGVLALGAVMALIVSMLTDISLPTSVGLLTGAATNTPMLGAAQQSLLEVYPDATATSNEMAMACAVGYPFGVIGVILCVVILKLIFHKPGSNTKEQHDNQTFVSEFRISNPAIYGKAIKDIMKDVSIRLVVSRVWKFNGNNEDDANDGTVIIPNGDTILEKGEHVLVMTKETETGIAEKLFGETVHKDWNKKDIDWNHLDSTLVSRHVLVTQPHMNGAKLGDLHLRNAYGINITRVNRAGIDILPSSGLHLQIGDKLTIVGKEVAIDRVAEVLGNQEKELRNPNLFSIFIGLILGLLLGSIPFAIPGMSIPVKLGIAGGIAEKLFGETVHKDWNKKDIDWNHLDSTLVSRHVLVTQPHMNGAKLGDLHLRNAYGINITRVNRAGIDILPSSGLHLQIGDKLTIVGKEVAIDRVAEVLGNQEKELRNPNLFSIFIGLILGLLLGSIPFAIPGMSIPVKLGIAGGPIIVGILMGAYGSRMHLTTYTTRSANLMLRQMGLTIYLAGLGLSAGPGFFETVFQPEGLLWILLSFLMAIVPVLIMGFIATKFCKTSYASNIGMLCGAMANPIALNYALSTVENDEPSVAYATVYPVEMFLHVITAQMIMLLYI